MRVCCTANAPYVGATNDKEHGGRVGIIKTEDGKRNLIQATWIVHGTIPTIVVYVT